MQRWLSIGLAASVALAIGVASYLQRPQWEVFYKANDPTEVTALTEKLDELNVQYKVTGDGMTITVPSTERSAANLAKAQAGLPSGGHVGLEIFAETSFGATEFDKKVNLERAMEGELARSLMRIREIQYATVNLNIPEKSVFIRDRQEPTASVLLQPRTGATLTKENVLAVMNFVASTVDGMKPERVTVINDKGVLLSKGLADPDQANAVDADALAQQRAREQQLQEKILSVLEPAYGAGNVAASVNVELDLAATRVEERIVGQGVPKVEEKVQSGATTTSSGTGTNPTTTTNPTEPTTATPPPVYVGTETNNASTDEYSNKTTTQYDYGERNQVTVSPAGIPKRISAAITINREELSPAQIQQVQNLVATATGAAVADVAVVAMSFAPIAPSLINQPVAEPTAPIQPLTLALGLGMAAFFLILAAFLTRRRKPEPAMIMPGVAAQPATGTTLDVALGLDQPLPAGQTAATFAAGNELAPEMSTTPAGAAQRLEEVLKKRKPKRATIDVEDMDDDILADIDVLIEQAPEACAEVIRQWLKGGI